MSRSTMVSAAVSPLKALQQRLGHEFKEPALLARALTHKSFGQDHYERLEFLGDAVLNLAVSSMLYARFDRSDEGDLTRVRAHLVRQDMLHKLALSLDLPAVMKMSEGESRGGGAQRPSILADALEAIIGAVYLDAGFDTARDWVLRLFEPVMAETTLEVWSKDAKTALQEWLQGRKMAVPVYRVDSTRGKAHEQVFVVACDLPDFGISVLGEGLSKRAAEQVAAQLALLQVQQLPSPSLKLPDQPGAGVTLSKSPSKKRAMGAKRSS
ncbi:ribonuclease III [Aquabacterium sp. CECT 9606]|uniref:ribonuclease III n=1 Tax=Aquabacterium sp. CECT 9606 TaxID=2845822 RepID=UPI001E2A7435|nr:ribonuclease III [Aquabacterium sp. CECT 9606]CAH0353589.1 Ribonuclease 3 [Aquabacterium sp. CECT 9606]